MLNLVFSRGLISLLVGLLIYSTIATYGKAPVSRNSGVSLSASMGTKAETRIYSPGDNIEFTYALSGDDLLLPVWVGLMKASEPRRNMPFSEPSININPFQPKSLEMRASGVFSYTAPSEGGAYEIRMFEKEGGTQLATLPFRVENRFIEELRAWKIEIEKARKNMELRYGSRAIVATYNSAFAAAGASQYAPKYLSAWSDTFWTNKIATNKGTVATRHYHAPIGWLSDSITHIAILRWPYSAEDVKVYRRGMQVWRSRHLKMYPLFEQYIALDAERARFTGDHYAKVPGMDPDARRAEDARFGKQKAAWDKRFQDLSLKFYDLEQAPAIFTSAAGQKPKP